MQVKTVILLFTLTILATSPAIAGSCASDLTEQAKVKVILDCLKSMETELNDKRAAPVQEVKAAIMDDKKAIAQIRGDGPTDAQFAAAANNWLSSNQIEKAEVPKGAIVAFDRANGCPKGWQEFAAAAGRVIVAVDGKKYKLPYVAGKPEYVIGGAEQHTLSNAEMPRHRHDSGHYLVGTPLQWGINHPVPTTGNAGGKIDHIMWQGGSKPHNNMPPFIALYLCKKN